MRTTVLDGSRSMWNSFKKKYPLGYFEYTKLIEFH